MKQSLGAAFFYVYRYESIPSGLLHNSQGVNYVTLFINCVRVDEFRDLTLFSE